ncbi:MAG: DEAD/DEAH box helicase, partial [Chloroflexi bacterium]
MYIDGRPLSIDAFRGFVQSIIERAKAILTEELLFGDATPLETLNLFELVDDFEVSNKNHSFMSEECNEMAEGRRGMMNRLKGNKGRWDEMMQMNEERNELKFNSFKAREYESQVERFLELLLILIHITGGQPARGAEITTLRYVNWSTGTRNIFVEDGQIMIVTSYHKAQALTDKLNVIPRFLPEAVGKMLVIYLANVIPFRQLLNHRHETTETQGFLWASDTSKNKSRTWGTQRLTTCLKRESGKELGMELTTSDYRHIAKAINRMYVRGLTRGMNEEDEEEEEEDADDLQACHGKEMADDVYGIRGDILRSLTERSISVFRDVSRRWHSFLKLESKGKRTKKRSNDREIEGQLMKRTQFKVTMKEVREQLKNLYGANGTFKSKEQEAGMQAITNNASPLIIILPTGGGKSLLFMMPTKLKGARTTIVVIPFIALIDDMLKRCKNADISCVEWKPNCNERVSIVIVSADRAVTGRFKGYAMGLHLKGQLDRIVIDESHLTLTAASYRRCMRQLKTLAIPVQLVSLTATLPPRMEKDFEEGLMIQGAQYIRASTNRRNFKYSVEGVDSMEDMQERVKEMIEGDKKKRRMIFCRSRVKCERMANILQCEVYHAGLEGRSECAKRWVTNGGPIVATGALGTGMDIEGIEE